MTARTKEFVIYQSCCFHLPLAASHLHFLRQEGRELSDIDLWRRPATIFSVMGIDKDDRVVCALVTGRYNRLYQQAIAGLARIFDLRVELVDLDSLTANAWPRLSLPYIKMLLGRFCTAWWGKMILPDLQVILPAVADNERKSQREKL